MRFVEKSPFVDPDAAARKLVKIAKATPAVRDGWIDIERINGPFLYQLRAHLRNIRPALSVPSPTDGCGCMRAAPT